MANTTQKTTKNIVRVIVVSPSDVQAQRNVIPDVIDDLNKGLADNLGLRLEVLMWETDAYPGFHLDGPQGLIDNVLRIEDSEIVIGIFWKRFGTPTKDSDSGTGHELKKAWECWKHTSSPQVMVYFSQESYSPKSKLETDQWGAVLEFQANFPNEGLWWPFSGVEQFERLVRNHLTAFLLKEYKPRHANNENESEGSFWEAPSFTDQVNRDSLLSMLHSKIETNSVVAVEGLAGSGKTYLATSYVSKQAEFGKQVIWYDPREDEKLDEFLAQISARVPLSGLSTISKCKELLSYLYKRKVLLIVDDFHLVDEGSFSNLVNIAVRYREPANLLVISRTYVDLLRNLTRIGHVEVRGFDIEEMRFFLKSRGTVRLNPAILNTLISKTDGLPLAASLFATLVNDFNRHPNDLLRDSILSTEKRLKSWFQEVCSLIGATELKLLRMLSMVDGPFNMGVVRALGRHGKIPTVDQAFESLQRTYLVQRYSPYRWNIHHLISMFCAEEFTEEEKEDVHRTLARYYLRSFYIREPRVLSEKEFTWKVRACKQYQLARDFRDAQRIIHDISKTAKTRGYYETLMHLIEFEIKSMNSRSGWIDYHYAHCCLITGRLNQGLKVIEPLLYMVEDKDSNQRVAFTRLYAEIIGSMGNPELALKKLREVLVTSDLPVKPNIRAQASSVEAWLLTLLARYKEAEDVCLHNLKDSRQRTDRMGEAVAATRLGIIRELSGYPENAHKELSDAVVTFRELEDRRGLAWSLAHLAFTKISLDNDDGAIANLQEAVRIEADIGGCSVDYFKLLKDIKNKCKNRRILRLVDAEIRRVSWALDDLPNSLPPS